MSYKISNVTQIPFVFGLAITLCFLEFGWSFLAGLSVIILAIIANLFIGIGLNKIMKVLMRKKDARMTVTTESINNIKMLKLNDWESNFLTRIFRRRSKEIVALRNRGFLFALMVSSVNLFPNLMAPATFSTYIGLGHTLDFSLAVASLVLFNLMKSPLISVPLFFGDFIDLMVSMKRIDKFISLHEVQRGIIEHVDSDPSWLVDNQSKSHVSLQIKGDFSWGFSSTKKARKKKKSQEESTAETELSLRKGVSRFITLKHINLSVQKGEFICIIGDVGSGKSSLLNAIIGDLIYVPRWKIYQFGGFDKEANDEEFEQLQADLLHPELEIKDKPIHVSGTISYVEQEPWIQNKTIKDNILFGLPFDSKRYVDTIRAC